MIAKKIFSKTVFRIRSSFPNSFPVLLLLFVNVLAIIATNTYQQHPGANQDNSMMAQACKGCDTEAARQLNATVLYVFLIICYVLLLIVLVCRVSVFTLRQTFRYSGLAIAAGILDALHIGMAALNIRGERQQLLAVISGLLAAGAISAVLYTLWKVYNAALSTGIFSDWRMNLANLYVRLKTRSWSHRYLLSLLLAVTLLLFLTRWGQDLLTTVTR